MLEDTSDRKIAVIFATDVVGYSNEVIFPIDLLLKNIGQPLNIRAIVEILVCDDVCIPHVMDLALDLPSGLASPTNYANIISRYRALVPGDGRNSGITFEGASYKRSSSNPILEVKFSSTSELVNPDLLVEGLNYKVFSKPNFKFYDNRKTVLIKVNINEGYGEYGLESLNNQPLRLTFFDGDRSIEKKTIPLQSTLSADKSDYNYFNSNYHLLSYIEGLKKYLQKMPDFKNIDTILISSVSNIGLKKSIDAIGHKLKVFVT